MVSDQAVSAAGEVELRRDPGGRDRLCRRPLDGKAVEGVLADLPWKEAI